MGLNILFVVNGLGLGNSTRAHAIIEYLLEMGASVHIATSNNGLWYFRDVTEIKGLYEIRPLQYGSGKGKINIWQTLRLLPELIGRLRTNEWRITEILDEVKPDIVVIDSEYIFRPMKKKRIPIVALNNSDAVIKEFLGWSQRPLSVIPQFLAVECMDYLFHLMVPNLVISPRLVTNASNRGFLAVGPVVRRRYLPVTPAPMSRRVVVMLSGSSFGSVLNFQREDYPMRIDVIGRSAPNEISPQKGIFYHGKIRDTHALLSAADVLVVNGGFSAVSEAFSMRKPAVLIPVPHHAEQWVNAKKMESLGVAVVATAENFEEKMFEALNRCEEILENYRKLKFENGALQAALAISGAAKKARA